MREAWVRIVNEKGLHTRTSTQVVQLAKKFESHIEISLDGVVADGKSVMGVLALGAKKGRDIRIRVRGPDKEEALSALVKLIQGGFPEDTP